MRGVHQQRGVAMILVLLLVALMALVATQLSGRTQLSIQRASNLSQYEQAYWYALGGERLARGLIEAAKESDNRIHLRQAWASPLLSYPIDGGYIQLRILDQRTCYNLNTLAPLETPQDGNSEQPPALQQFARLLTLLGEGTVDTATYIDPLRDWVDADTLPSGYAGAEDLYYSGQTPAYLPANGRLVDLTELNFIEGFRAVDRQTAGDETDLVDAMKPLLCALPSEQFQINVNTLESERAPLLAALFDDSIPLQEFTEALEARPEEGWGAVDELWNTLIHTDERRAAFDESLKQQLRIDSDYFLVRIEVTYYDANLVLYSRLALKENKPVTYQRHYGAFNG